jgi:TFIIF-interacting CTD phosphatase-like protein
VIDDLDNTRVVEHRLFREHCTFDDEVYIKDVSRLGRNLKDIIIIDVQYYVLQLISTLLLRMQNYRTRINPRTVYSSLITAMRKMTMICIR